MQPELECSSCRCPSQLAPAHGYAEHTPLHEVRIIGEFGDLPRADRNYALRKLAIVGLAERDEFGNHHRLDAGDRCSRGINLAGVNRLTEDEIAGVEQPLPAPRLQLTAERDQHRLLHVAAEIIG